MPTFQTIVVVYLLSGSAMAESLSPNFFADKLLLEATGAVERGNIARAEQIIQRVEVLDADPSLAFVYRYAKVLAERDVEENVLRSAKALLITHLTRADRTAEHYLPALELLLDFETRLAHIIKQTPLKARLPGILRKFEAQMVHVEGGTFTMGCTQEQQNCDEDERPLRNVEINGFWIARYEVTQDLWQEIMGDNPSSFANCPGCPIETVSWDDIQIFLKKLNSGGTAFRLPSEAEWEYAARGGKLGRGYQFSGSDDWTNVAWYYENSGNQTHRVGQKAPNELGLYDMSGNVREWVQDCWQNRYIDVPSYGRAREEQDCANRTIRGGSWYGKPSYVRSANRFWYPSWFRNNNLGFRIAISNSRGDRQPGD